MQVRYNQLMKQQEKMIQDMERTVSRREAIANRGDYLAKNSSAKVQLTLHLMKFCLAFNNSFISINCFVIVLFSPNVIVQPHL